MSKAENKIIDQMYDKHSTEDSFNYRAAMKEYAELKVKEALADRLTNYVRQRSPKGSNWAGPLPESQSL